MITLESPALFPPRDAHTDAPRVLVVDDDEHVRKLEAEILKLAGLNVATAAEGALRPLEWCDRALAWWRRASPLVQCAAVPLAIVARRRIFPRAKFFGSLLGWAPGVFGLIRLLTRPRD